MMYTEEQIVHLLALTDFLIDKYNEKDNSTTVELKEEIIKQCFGDKKDKAEENLAIFFNIKVE